MRTHLLATIAAVALLAAMPARAQDATWLVNPGSGNFNTAANWTPATVPTGTAFFGVSNQNNVSVSAGTRIGGWTFNAGASNYVFMTTGLTFTGAGIVINGGSATITNGLLLLFNGSSTAGSATITNNFAVQFVDSSTAGSATITNNGAAGLAFFNSSTAGSATIINRGGAFVDISPLFTAGMTAGSIEGGGAISLGSKNLAVGGNNLSTTFTGVLQDGGGAGGTGGSLTKTGTGTLTLSGASTYTGATAINAGTLQAGAANAFAPASAFTVASGATLDLNSFNQSIGSLAGAGSVTLGSATLSTGNDNTSTTFSGTILGGGGLTKIGSGLLTLSGVNTYAGGTTVNAGTLIVNGSIASSSLTTVNSGGTLAGTGTVGSVQVNSGGTFAPGNSPGTMTVQGNLAFQSGAIYLVQVNPSTASSTNVTAGGSATLAGTVQAAFAPGSYLARTYTILSASGGRIGTFDSLSTAGLPAGFQVALSYSNTSAFLNLIAAVEAPGETADERSVAHALDTTFNTGHALPPNLLPVFNLTGGDLDRALDELDGEVATGAQQAAFQLMNQFLGVMLDPFVDGRSGVGGGGAIGFAPEREALPDDIALAYAKILKEPPKPPSFEQRWSVWGAGYGGSNRTSGDVAVVGSHDLSARTAGGAAGLDYRLAPGTVVGFALAGGGTNWGLAQGLGTGKSDAFQAGVYGTARSGPAYLAAALAYTNHWMSTDRFAFAGDHLAASFNAQSFGGRLEGGYRFATIYGGLTPYAAIQSQSFHTPSYSEADLNGGGDALAFNSRNATDTRSELGGRFDRLLLLDPTAALTLRARAAWAHDAVSDPTLAAAFQTLPGSNFIVSGATPAKNSALTSAGVELRLANGVTAFAKFDGEFAGHSSTYAGTGTVRYTW